MLSLCGTVKARLEINFSMLDYCFINLSDLQLPLECLLLKGQRSVYSQIIVQTVCLLNFVIITISFVHMYLRPGIIASVAPGLGLGTLSKVSH